MNYHLRLPQWNKSGTTITWKETKTHIFSNNVDGNDDTDNDDAQEWNSIDIHGWYFDQFSIMRTKNEFLLKWNPNKSFSLEDNYDK